MPTDFEKMVYEKTKQIPCGRVTTYKEISRVIKRPGAARAVGNALNKNPDPIAVPCHRVVCSNHVVGGFALGKSRKIEILKEEGVNIFNDIIKDEIWRF